MATTITVVEEDVVIEVATSGLQGATGATGPTGPSGTVAVTSPITNSGTSTAANIGINQGAITIAKTQVTGTAVTLADTGTVTNAMIADSSISTAKIANGAIIDADINASAAIAVTKIAGTAVITTDSRLSDTRTPTDGTVTNAKIVSTGLDMSSINSGAITAWAPLTSYTKGDLVSYAGVAYRRIATSTSGTTFEPANWNQMTPAVDKDVLTAQPTNGLDIVPRALLIGARTLANGTQQFSLFTPNKDITVSNFVTACTTAGTDTGGTTVRRIGLCTVNTSTNAFTVVARTANTPTLWNSAIAYTTAMDTAGGFPSSYTLLAGVTYAITMIAYNTGGTFGQPAVIAPNGLNTLVTALSPIICGQLTTQTDLNTSGTISASTANGPWARLT